jgi:iron(III)-salmochelin esterase
MLSSASVRILRWDLGVQSWGAGRAVVVVPTFGQPDTRFPVVVALHGRGESLKPPDEGALGWPRDYALVRAFDRLRAPPLRASDFVGLVEPEQLAMTNLSLSRQPFVGVIVACPWLPDLRPTRPEDLDAYAEFVLGVLLPRVRMETPALADAQATGIDGVSLGGAFALGIGLEHPTAFGAVGGIQPALAAEDTAMWVTAAKAARARHPSLKLRLLTSYDDYFHDSISEVSQAWQDAGVPHDFGVYPGPHDYVFNRGPGSIELLLWNDRSLHDA